MNKTIDVRYGDKMAVKAEPLSPVNRMHRIKMGLKVNDRFDELVKSQPWNLK